jgi:hypothetical protein
VRAEPIKETVQRLQASLAFLGKSTVHPKRDGTQIICRFDSEFAPSMRLRLKVEANTREHFSVLGWAHVPFEVESAWYAARCTVTTYPLKEPLGTKLRAFANAGRSAIYSTSTSHFRPCPRFTLMRCCTATANT